MKLVLFENLMPDYGIPYTPEHLRRLEAAGKFPKRIKLGDDPRSRTAWTDEDIKAYIAAKAAARESAQ
jgi:prophage regulatory protein